MEIKMLNSRDAEAYYKLRLEALLDSPDAYSTLYEDALEKPIEKTRMQLASEHSVTFGAFVNGRLIGNMTLARNQLTKMAHRATVVAVYVSPNYRGTGAAAKIMDSILEFAAAWKGLEQLDLMVASENARAKNFYLRYGFEKYGTEVHSMKVAEKYIDEDLMVKFLK